MENSFSEFQEKGWTMIRRMISSADTGLIKSRIVSFGARYDSNLGTDQLQERTSLLLADRHTAKVVADIAQHPFIKKCFDHSYTRPGIDHTKLLVKAGGGPMTSWHQDSGFWKVFDPELTMFTVWIPLADVREEDGCLRILDTGPAISRRENYPHEPVNERRELAIPESFIDPLLAKYPIVDCSMQASDALIFKSWVIHSAYPNKTPREREAFKISFQDFAKRPQETPLTLPLRAVKLSGLSGLFNRLNACAATRWNKRLRRMARPLKPLLRR